MSDIPRWSIKPFAMRDRPTDDVIEPDDDGPYMLADDVVEALRQAEERSVVYVDEIQLVDAREQGRRDALAGADGYPMIPATECERQVRSARADTLTKAAAAIRERGGYHTAEEFATLVEQQADGEDPDESGT